MGISIFTTPAGIHHKLTRLFPGENVSEDDVLEWCMDCEINYIKDGDLSAKFIDVPIDIDKASNMAALPCNIIRVIDVYNEHNKKIEYQLVASNHIKVKTSKDKVLMTYLGVNVDEDGVPSLYSSHDPALLTWCKIQMLEPKVLSGKSNANLMMKYEAQFSNQVTAIKQSATNKDKKHYDDVNIIQWNMIRKVGHARLYKNMFI